MSHSPVSLSKPSTARSERGDETTRHLCAGVYHDPEFRDLVIRDVLTDPVHRAAPSYGFDLVAVADHAWRAWTLETAQHACTLSLLVIAFAGNVPVAVTVICGLALWGLAIPTLRLALQVVHLKTRTAVAALLRRYKTTGELELDNELKERVWWFKLGLVCCALALVLPVVAAGSANVPLGRTLLWAAIFLALMGLVTSVSAVLRHRRLIRVRRAGTLRPPRLTRRQRAIHAQQTHPVAVYRRPEPRDEDALRLPYDPDDEPSFFVGSGKLVHRWLPPLSVQLLRAKSEPSVNGLDGSGGTQREFVRPPFAAHELVDHLKHEMKPIGRADDPIRLPGYHVLDRVYVAEPDLPGARDLMAHSCDRSRLRQLIDEPYRAAQHFLEIRATSSGELVVTVFLRVTVKGRSLSLDFAACALTRTPPAYQRPVRTGRAAVTRTALTGLRTLPIEMVRSWRMVKAPWVLLRMACTSLWPRELEPVRGTLMSIREEKSVPWRQSDFDLPVILDHMKIVELRLLKATKDFLTTHQVDTSTFDKRAETIISASVLNMGGHMNINDSAVGGNAQINQHAVVPHGTGNAAPQGA
ncbi:hypothetical protein ACQEU3_25255 [Spirillospora sp. CA-253888]